MVELLLYHLMKIHSLWGPRPLFWQSLHFVEMESTGSSTELLGVVVSSISSASSPWFQDQ